MPKCDSDQGGQSDSNCDNKGVAVDLEVVGKSCDKDQVLSRNQFTEVCPRQWPIKSRSCEQSLCN